MDRRTFGAGLLMGGLGLAAAPAIAQHSGHMGPMTDAERRHVMDTLQIGGVSLRTSQLAQSRAGRPLVRQFANFEAEEATTIATILGEISGMAPPPPRPADQRVIERLQRVRGAAFDREYLIGQLDGHQRLLRVQERYLNEGRNQHHRHIAMLARGRIIEHIRDIQTLQSGRG